MGGTSARAGFLGNGLDSEIAAQGAELPPSPVRNFRPEAVRVVKVSVAQFDMRNDTKRNPFNQLTTRSKNYIILGSS